MDPETVALRSGRVRSFVGSAPFRSPHFTLFDVKQNPTAKIGHQSMTKKVPFACGGPSDLDGSPTFDSYIYISLLSGARGGLDKGIGIPFLSHC